MHRVDIQCLRGISILAVILFHVWPRKMPNGYLGVDIFFVISGYLMALILCRNKISPSSMFEFYYKRVKRITLIYLTVVFGANMLKHLFQSHLWWNVNNVYAMFSAIFLTNQKIIHDRNDYFKAVNADLNSNNIFLHCWSLSVEMQFYIIVPFIIYGLEYIKDKNLKMFSLVVVSLASYSITFISVDPNFTHNFMIARVWQFQIGIMAYIMKSQENTEKEIMKKKSSGNEEAHSAEIAYLCSIFLIFFPATISDYILRPYITVLSGYIIYRHFDNIPLFQSKTLAYIGDISYILYLVHWPFIIFFQNVFDGVLMILTIFIVSTIIHHGYEKIILNQSRKTILGITALLFFGTLLSAYFLIYNPDLIKRTYSTVYETEIRQNEAFLHSRWISPNCTIQPIPEYPNGLKYKFGHCKFVNGTGTRKVLLIGNSYALNQAEVVLKSLHGNYSTFEYVAIIANYGLAEDGNDGSTVNIEISKRIVAEVKPDLLYIIVRYPPFAKEPKFENPNSDDVLWKFNENIQFYERFSNRVFIMDAFPLYPINFLKYFIENLMLDYDAFDKFRIPVHEMNTETINIKQRLKTMKCEKCHIYDLSPVLRKGNYYYGYDELTNLAYIDNDIHLTPPALEKIYKPYRNLILNHANGY